MKKWKYVSVLGVASCALAIGLTGCGGKKDDTVAKIDVSELKPYGKYDKTVSFTVGTSKKSTETLLKGDTVSNNSYTRYLKEHSNVEAKIAWEAADYNQKLSLAISTGDIPDVMVVGQDQYEQMAENNLLLDLTDLYDKAASDNLKKFISSYDQDLLKVTTKDNKLMAIPTPYPYFEENEIWIRKEWLDKLNLPVPETMEQLGEVAKKFIESDVSGTGKTMGITFHAQLTGADGSTKDAGIIFNQYNSYPKSWMSKDGKAVYGSIQPETKEVLSMLADWYKEGVVDKEFATRTDDEKIAALADKMGIYIGPFWGTDFANSYKKDMKADWIAITPSKTEGEKFKALRPQPVNQFVVISKKCKNPEAVMRAINDTIDFTNSLGDSAEFRKEEAKKAGVESLKIPWYLAPISMNITDANKNVTETEQLEKALETGDRDSLPDFLLSFYDGMKDFMDGKSDDAEKYLEYKQGIPAIINEDKVEFVDKAFYGKTPSMLKMGANLQKLEDETFVKIVMGQASIDEFDNFVEQWKKQGGDKIQEEVQKAVDAGEIQ